MHTTTGEHEFFPLTGAEAHAFSSFLKRERVTKTFQKFWTDLKTGLKNYAKEVNLDVSPDIGALCGVGKIRVPHVDICKAGAPRLLA